MPTLEFRYEADQPHQLEAVEAVCGLFRGQRFAASSFSLEGAAGPGPSEALQEPLFGAFQQPLVFDTVGHGNSLRLAPGQLLENLHAVQEANCLPPTEVYTGGRLRDFTVEMETGTGKTYVYTRTIYELNRRFGLTKFVVVVPSVAIREGVMKSLASTRAHFDGLYDRAPLDYFLYDSKNMAPVGSFATSSSMQVMVINIQAFNKGFDKGGAAAGTAEGNLFHRPSEKLPGGWSPQEMIAACRPVVIIDEPQSVDNTRQAKGAIASLNPLFVLRYSATHRERYNLVYRLTPVDAFERHLVKEICVDSIRAEADLNGAYVRFEEVNAARRTASFTIDVLQPDGTQARKKVRAKVGQSLYELSRENPDYEAGWILSNFETAPGREFAEFQNGELLALGQAVGDAAEEAVRRAQIRRTIDDHLERQWELWPRGVKVLSLFFIDRVERYRAYDPEPHGGPYARMFEEEYAAALDSLAGAGARMAVGDLTATWRACYEAAGIPLCFDPARVHEGYFARDGRGRFKDSRGAAGTEADRSAFELIMRSKETLVSFPDGRDPARDVAFIWSHSALKEGWDNPNVFQICTLVETRDTLTKRQKIGRGLRLCVDQQGARCLDPEANRLTVVANESYEAFAAGLQRELEADDFRFGIVGPETFTRVVLPDADGVEEPLGYEGSAAVYGHLVDAGLVDAHGAVTPGLKEQAERGAVDLPAGYEDAQAQVAAIILQKAAKVPVRNKAEEVRVRLDKDVTASPAFQELWERIRRRTRFEVEVDSARIIRDSIEGISKMPHVRRPRITSERAGLAVTDAGVEAGAASVSVVDVAGARAYDLPDPVGQITDAVGLTRSTVKAILEGCGRMDEFPLDPATFLEQATERIRMAKNDAVAAGIKYVKLPEDEWYTMEALDPGELVAYRGQNAWEPAHAHKSLYTHVVYDSSTVERPFAEALDAQEEVLVFAKLPARFKIDTPLGPYNPDWAYVEQEPGGGRRVYFVTETKGGGNGTPALRDSERTKVSCARKHFAELELGGDFRYNVGTTYELDYDSGAV